MSINFRIIILCMGLVVFHSHYGFAQYDEVDTVALPEVVLGEEGETEESEVSDLREEDKKTTEIRKVNTQELEEIRKEDDFWYVNELKKKEKKAASPPRQSWLGKLLNSGWFGTLMWIIVIGAFIGILVWFLTTMDASILRKPAKKIRDNDTADEHENIFEIDFDKAIAAAVRAGNFRLGVRLMYLQLLKELSEKNIIRYNPQRPNSEYVMQLYGTNYYHDFFSITRNFEYAWYGGFHVSPVAFEKIRADVSGLKTRIA